MKKVKGLFLAIAILSGSSSLFTDADDIKRRYKK